MCEGEYCCYIVEKAKKLPREQRRYGYSTPSQHTRNCRARLIQRCQLYKGPPAMGPENIASM